MMKTLILSFFTFLSIYIEGLEIFPYPQIFFKNIKMQPRYNRKCYSLIFQAAGKVLIVIDSLW